MFLLQYHLKNPMKQQANLYPVLAVQIMFCQY